MYPSQEADPDHGTRVVIEQANIRACLNRRYLFFGTISTFQAAGVAVPSHRFRCPREIHLPARWGYFSLVFCSVVLLGLLPLSGGVAFSPLLFSAAFRPFLGVGLYFPSLLGGAACAINLDSITNSGLIPGGQNLSKRQTVFLTSVDPMNKEHRDPNNIDLEAPRLAWYHQKNGRNIKTWCIGSTHSLLRRKDLSSIRHDRTQSSFTTHSLLIVSRNLP